MAAIASSSSSSPSPSPSPSGIPPRPPKDVFKPKFPLDPFSGHSAAALGEPWFLKLDVLLNATALQSHNVIFVIGAPSLTELGPLLQSRQLAKSLVILATHKPPDIPAIVYPTVRVLRLSTPLALEDAGAVRFVNVLEWGERVARTWRKNGGAGVLELSEEVDINSNTELKPPSVFRFGTQSTPASPGSSTTQLSGEPATPSRPTSRPPSIVSTLFLKKGIGSLPPPDPSQRPFDVLINFLPEKVSDKALLKNSILVTTISRPFLKSTNDAMAPTIRSRTTSSSSSSPRLTRPRSIFSAFSRSSSSVSVYLPPTPPYQSGESLPLSSISLPALPGKALLVQVLPSPHPNEPPGARRRLVDSMESFLVSFSFQSAPGMQSQPRTYSPGTASGIMSRASSPELDRARPYVMHTTTFRDSVWCDPALGVDSESGECQWTVADIVLSGALDADTPTPSAPTPALAGAGAAGRFGRLAAARKRAWIAAAADLMILAPGDEGQSVPHDQVAGAVLPGSEPTTPTRAFSRTARSSSAPLLSAEWTPTNFGGRPLSQPAQQQQHQRHVLARPPAVVPRDGKGAYGQAPMTTEASHSGSTLSPPTMSPSSTADSSSLGPPTPPQSSEENCVVKATEEKVPGIGVGLSVMAASTVDIVSVDGEGGRSAKSVKVGKWKFWRRNAGSGDVKA